MTCQFLLCFVGFYFLTKTAASVQPRSPSTSQPQAYGRHCQRPAMRSFFCHFFLLPLGFAVTQCSQWTDGGHLRKSQNGGVDGGADM
ncbi:hypothetical protein LZ32DRAFT_22549 [Colletotrichum eremochloae]|nr:hypothetical protein LZ32DRAFT_22549 [Colletotrichum eremochloae]